MHRRGRLTIPALELATLGALASGLRGWSSEVTLDVVVVLAVSVEIEIVVAVGVIGAVVHVGVSILSIEGHDERC